MKTQANLCVGPHICNLCISCSEGVASCYGCCLPVEGVSSTYWALGLVGPRTDLGIAKRKIPPFARNVIQMLYPKLSPQVHASS